jgi:hypothetical protein
VRRVACLAAASLAALLAGSHASARSLHRQTFFVDLRTSTLLPATAPVPSSPPLPRPVNLRCRDHATASFAVHGGVVEITDSGQTHRVRFAPLDDTRNRMTWYYAQAGVALAAVRTFNPGVSSGGGHDELVAVDLATGTMLWARSLPDTATDCFIVGGSIAICHGVGLELLNPRTGTPTGPAVTVTGWPTSLLGVATDRVLYCTSLEMAMLETRAFRVLWRAPIESGQDVALTPTTVLTTALARSPTGAEASLVTRDVKTGALLRTTPLTHYSSFFDDMASQLTLRGPNDLEVQLSFIVLD